MAEFGLPSSGAAVAGGGGEWEQIGSPIDVTGLSEIAITDITHNNLMLVFDDVGLSGGYVELTLSSDNGSTFDSTGYYWADVSLGATYTRTSGSNVALAQLNLLSNYSQSRLFISNMKDASLNTTGHALTFSGYDLFEINSFFKNPAGSNYDAIKIKRSTATFGRGTITLWGRN